MGTRIIHNKRPKDNNIQKNRIRVEEPQQFTLPPDAIRTISERDAVVAALEVFTHITLNGLRIPGRDNQRDEALIESAALVHKRLA